MIESISLRDAGEIALNWKHLADRHCPECGHKGVWQEQDTKVEYRCAHCGCSGSRWHGTIRSDAISLALYFYETMIIAPSHSVSGGE